jgi:hypothetical protein
MVRIDDLNDPYWTKLLASTRSPKYGGMLEAYRMLQIARTLGMKTMPRRVRVEKAN